MDGKPESFGLKAVLERLRLSHDAKVLHVGGSLQNAQRNSLPALVAHGIGSVDFLNLSAADAEKLLETFPGGKRLAEPGDIALSAYDLVVLNPGMAQIEETLKYELTARWAFVIRPGGAVAAFGIDSARVETAGAWPSAGLRQMFAPGGPWRDPVPNSGDLAHGFHFSMRTLRTAGRGFLTWDVFTQACDVARDRLLEQTGSARTWGDLTQRPEYIAFAAEAGASMLVHQLLNGLFARREIRLYRASVAALPETCAPSVRLFHQLNLARYAGDIEAAERVIRPALEKLAHAGPLRRGLAGLIVEHAVRQRNIGRAEQALREGFEGQASQLGETGVAGLAQVYLDGGEAEKARSLLEAHLAGRPEWMRLKFLRILRQLQCGDTGATKLPENWRECLAELTQATPIANAMRDNAALSQALAGLQEMAARMPDGSCRDCIDLRADGAASQVIAGKIESALSEGRGLALLRLGDGEAYALSGGAAHDGGATEDADNRWRERLWWGSSPPADIRAEIRSGVRAAIASADILGLPSVYRLVRDLGNDPARFGEHPSQRGLAAVIAAGLDAEGAAVVTEERCNQLLMGREQLMSLAAHAEKIIWVSCWPLQRLRLDLDMPQLAVRTPPHVQVESAGEAGQPPFWSTYPDLLAQLRAEAAPHTLVCVAAGLIGKVFVHEARRAGAVALDIGAIADYLAGRKTRSIADII